MKWIVREIKREPTELALAIFRAYQAGESRKDLAARRRLPHVTVNRVLHLIAALLREPLRRSDPYPPRRADSPCIFERYQAGESCGRLAREFKISHQRIFQIVIREAGGRNVPLRKGRRGPPRKIIPPAIVGAVMTGAMTRREAAVSAKASLGTVYRVCRGAPKMKSQRELKAEAFGAELYAKFVAGATLKELAKESGKTVGNVHQYIFRHRRLHDLPPPRSWRRGRRPQILVEEN